MADVHIIIKAGQMITAHDQPAVPRGAVAVSDHLIEAVGPYEELSRRYPKAKTVGGEDFLLIPENK